jgi:hypothetical protein
MTSLTQPQLREVSVLLKQSFPGWDGDRLKYAASAIEKIKSGKSGSLSAEEQQSILYPTEFSYLSPFEFEERQNPDKKSVMEKLMSGTALYPTTSRNFNVYSAEEIIKAAPSLKGVPVQADHSFKAKDTVGTVRNSMVSERGKLAFLAGLDPKDDLTQKAEAGYIKFVSVYGTAERSICTICKEDMTLFHKHWPGQKYDGKVAKVKHENITFRHLGMTNYPGVARAKIAGVESSIDEYGGILSSPSENVVFIQEHINGFNTMFESMNYEPFKEYSFVETSDSTGEYKPMTDEKDKQIEKMRMLLETSEAGQKEAQDKLKEISQKNSIL